ncbi:hypothetical protein CS063_10590 [Sporanaerobium hydrogeniformans]|uniref:Uncharacterized protein n=1 Tax=Sporanaerobium hydrogeniformans TaxID=3072179 RepID=A0AC61DC50_9FIRM|nr:hypothetical protein [Sporanaerobium hydrogeniformans]PHV70331.1 hypothetical protein CS063_10590 [Sporanaerobium hydrogeniformans]
MKKILGKCILFSLIFIVFTLMLGQLFGGTKNDTLDGFYYEKENTMDVLFFGSSHAYCGMNPHILWQEAGIPSYNLGQPEQQIWTTYYYMKEAFKHQRPKVVFLDVLTVNYDEPYRPLDNSNINLDDLKLNFTKLENIKASVRASERPYFVFKLLKNKGNWKHLKKENFTTHFIHLKHPNKGYREEFGIYENKKPELPTTQEIGILPEKVEHYLNKIITLCEEEGIQLVLMKTPIYVSEEAQLRYNRVKELAKNRDVPFLDFNEKYEELGLNFKEDYLDELKHLNFRGAEKLTRYLAGYLKENFNLPNHKEEQAYASWNVDLERWLRRDEELRLRQEKDLKTYLERLIASPYKEDYTLALTLQRGEGDTWQKELKEQEGIAQELEAIGFEGFTTKTISESDYYIGVIHAGELIYEEGGDQLLSFEKELGGIPWHIQFLNEQTSIKVGENETAKNKGQIQLVVYDKNVERIIDSSSFELQGETVKR